TRMALQCLCGTHRQVPLGREIRHAGDAFAHAVLTQCEPDRIAEVDQLEQRLQLVIAGRTAPDDGQEQVQFGRRWPPRQRRGYSRQVLTMSLSRNAWRVTVSRRGSHCCPTSA